MRDCSPPGLKASICNGGHWAVVTTWDIRQCMGADGDGKGTLCHTFLASSPQQATTQSMRILPNFRSLSLQQKPNTSLSPALPGTAYLTLKPVNVLRIFDGLLQV